MGFGIALECLDASEGFGRPVFLDRE